MKVNSQYDTQQEDTKSCMRTVFPSLIVGGAIGALVANNRLKAAEAAKLAARPNLFTRSLQAIGQGTAASAKLAIGSALLIGSGYFINRMITPGSEDPLKDIRGYINQALQSIGGLGDKVHQGAHWVGDKVSDFFNSSSSSSTAP
ncbi:MAG: hypothetical protein AAF621_07070 [Pseudomonadota bacterium]